jgi:hypothetical protein
MTNNMSSPASICLISWWKGYIFKFDISVIFKLDIMICSSYVTAGYGLGPPLALRWLGCTRYIPWQVHTILWTWTRSTQAPSQPGRLVLPVCQCHGAAAARVPWHTAKHHHDTLYSVHTGTWETWKVCTPPGRVAGLGGTYLGPGKTWNYVPGTPSQSRDCQCDIISDHHDDVGFKLYYDIVTVLSSW